MSEHSTEPDATRIDPRAHRVLADVSRVAVLETLRRAGRPLAIPEIAAEVGLHPNTVRSHLALLVKHGYATGRAEDRERPGRPRLLYTATAGPGEGEPDGDDRRNYRLLAEVLISYLTGDERPARAGGGTAAALAAGRAYGRRVAHGDTHLPPSASGLHLPSAGSGTGSPGEPSAEPGPPSGPSSGVAFDTDSGAGYEIREHGTGAGIRSGAGSGRGYGSRPGAGAAVASGAAPRIDAATATERIVALLQEAGFEPRLSPDGSHIDLHRCPFHELAEANPEVVCGVHLGLMQGALADLGAPITAVSLRPFARPGVCVTTLRPHDEESR